MTRERESITNIHSPKALQEREKFFEPAELKINLTGCGDERPVIGIHELLINIFGGPGANVAWNVKVLQEAAQAGSVASTFADTTAAITSSLVTEGIKTTVHSDDHTERKPALDVYQDVLDDIGCGYLKLRAVISDVIRERGGEITEILMHEKPEHYDNNEGKILLQKYISANAALANRTQIFTSGRDVARKAVDQGAVTIVVTGDHVAKVGFLNIRPNTSFDTGAAMKAGLPAYNHNTWAAVESYLIVQDKYGFACTDFEAANDVDAVGTMLALGVEEIYVRK